MKPTNERIQQAVKDAQEAFWNSIWSTFPESEVPSGDLPPNMMTEHDQVSEKAVRQWLNWNHPEMRNCDRCGSDLEANGLCSDQTCPFSDCQQDDPKGWTGHPEMEGK